MFCRKCGEEMKPGETVCHSCDMPVGSADANKGTFSFSFMPAGDLADEDAYVKAGTVKDDGDAHQHLRTPHFYFPDDLSKIDDSPAEPPCSHRRVHRYPEHEKIGHADSDQLFNRAPRLRTEQFKKQIVIQKPPAVSGKPEINWFSVLLPPLAMALLVALVSVLSGGISMYMLIMLPMQAISVVVAVINYRKQLKKHNEIILNRNQRYNKYLSDIRQEITEANHKQQSIANAENPSPAECVDIVIYRRKNLWERRPEDLDFGSFRVGRGQIPADVTAVWPERAITLEDNELEQKAAELGNSFKYIDDTPIVIPGNQSIIGIVGDAKATRDIARQAIIQLTTLHSYEDLKFGLVFPDSDREFWTWTRWLPHVQGEDSDLRLLATTQTGASVLKEKLLDVLQTRCPGDERSICTFPSGEPEYILILAAPDLFLGSDFFSRIAKAPNSRIRVIYLCRSLSQLPKECETIIETDGSKGCTYFRDSASQRISYTADTLAERQYEEFARAMAGIRLSEADGKHIIPNSVSFFEGYGLNRVEDYDIQGAWSRAKSSNSFAVPIGIDENGERFYFDIRDGKHGVHGLIGGMSGSGKSEMLQSWILSMAMNFSPQDVSFVLIDFKGTGLITPFVGLPHLAGTISDINVSSDIRRSKESLEYELKHREILFDKYGVQNIQSYIKLYNAGVADEQLPVLIVIIDEFAEFKKTFPEFMKWVESSFARGRSVGIWFILATQQPGSEASEAIKTNTHFKWCLKVNTASASKDMIGIPDAAQITRPGRAYIKVGGSSSNFLTQVQSFWSGAPYNADRDPKSETQKVAVVDIYGNRVYHSNFDGSTGYKTNKTEIEVAVAYIAKYAKENGIPSASRIWAERLGERFALSAVCKQGFDGKAWPEHHDGLNVTVGEVDDPKHQQKYPLVVPFTDCGHIVIYGAPATGKTTFLQTLIMSSALNYSPRSLNIYIMDFGSLSMRMFSAMPQVGGIAEIGQDERIGKLASLLRDELERRKNLFAKSGVGSISAYKDMPNSEPLPYILLIVDNFNAVLPTYPELDPFFVTLTQSGSNYGMYLAVSVTGINGLSYKLQPNFKMAYALRLTDKAEYSTVVNRTEGLVPENFMGRGLMRGDPPLQFQTALPADGSSDNEISRNIRIIAEQMQKSWVGKCAKRIPEMPETIEFGSIEGEGIHLGLSINKVEAVDFDYTSQHYLMISGMPESGKSNLLKVLAYQMYESANCTVYALDINGTGLKALQSIGTYISTAADIDVFFDELMPTLKKRQESGSKNNHFAPILLIIDDFTTFFSAVSEKTVKRLLAIIKLCAGLDIYLLTAAAAGELAVKRIQGEEVTMSFVTAKQAVLLGGCIHDHGAFKLKPAQGQRNIELRDKEGFFVSKSGIVHMKTMQEKKL